MNGGVKLAFCITPTPIVVEVEEVVMVVVVAFVAYTSCLRAEAIPAAFYCQPLCRG